MATTNMLAEEVSRGDRTADGLVKRIVEVVGEPERRRFVFLTDRDITRTFAEGDVLAVERTYDAQSARDAMASRYGGASYWRYLDRSAKEKRDYYLERGDTESAERMMTRSLGEALAGNDGD